LIDPTKFFGCELGAQTTFDEKADRYIVNGAHEASRLRELLDAFIDKFVLCGSCKNPETDIIITKSEDIIRDCKACGQRTNVDMRHKLVPFILKNPPKVKKSRKATKEDTAANGDANDENGLDGDEGAGDSDDELTRRIKAEAAELQAKPVLEDGGWSVDTSEEAVKARVKVLESGIKNSLALGEDDSEEGGDDPYGTLGNWTQENRETASPASIYQKAEELGIEKKHKTAQILVQALFGENILEEIPKYSALFLKVRNIAICIWDFFLIGNASW
jgi:translation initiation factor 5